MELRFFEKARRKFEIKQKTKNNIKTTSKQKF